MLALTTAVLAAFLVFTPMGILARETPSQQQETPPVRGWTLDPQELFKFASRSVVTVRTSNGRQGSGVVWSTNAAASAALIVTNAHVIEGADQVTVVYGEQQYPATITLEVFIRADVAFLVVRAEADNVWIPAIRAKQLPEVGQRSYAVGSPLGLTMSLSDGLVSGLRKRRGIPVVQTTAPISPGSSGGGLFADDGQLIGITTASIVGGENLNLAVAVSEVLRLDSVWVDTASCPILGAEEADRNPKDETDRNDMREWLTFDAGGQAYASKVAASCESLRGAVASFGRAETEESRRRLEAAGESVAAVFAAAQTAYNASTWPQTTQELRRSRSKTSGERKPARSKTFFLVCKWGFRGESDQTISFEVDEAKSLVENRPAIVNDRLISFDWSNNNSRFRFSIDRLAGTIDVIASAPGMMKMIGNGRCEKTEQRRF